MSNDALALPEFNIQQPEELSEPNSILIYGPPGKGKTIFGASLSKVYDRVLVVDTEGSSVSIKPSGYVVDIIRTPTAPEFTRIIEALLNGKLVEPKSGLPYEAVIIDTFDKAQERQLDLFSRDKKAFNAQGVEDGFFKWGAIKLWTAKIADYLHQAPFLTVFIMHVDDYKDEKTGKVTRTVMLEGKSRMTFPSVSDAIGYFDVENLKENGVTSPRRVLDFSVTEKAINKQRFAEKLNGKIIDPTFEKIFAKIRS